MTPNRVNLAVIGSGGAAFAAAIHATALGKRLVMVERGTIGGTCVNTGCIPSKALIAAAEARHVAADGGRFPGIVATAGPVDMPALVGGQAGPCGVVADREVPRHRRRLRLADPAG